MRDACPRIWFDVEDLIRYFDGYARPTGTQRVGLELLYAAHNQAPDRVGFVRHRYFTRAYTELDESSFRALCPRGAMASPRMGAPAPLAKAGRYLSRFPPRLAGDARSAIGGLVGGQPTLQPEFRSGDVIVCLGTPWTRPEQIAALTQAKARFGVRFALLVHDIFPISHPDLCKASLNPRFQSWFARILPLTDLILCASKFNADALRAHCAATGRRLPLLRRIRFGDGMGASAKQDDRPFVPPTRDFVLYVSTIEIRKNHSFLLRVWARLIAKHGVDAVPDLAFAGRWGWSARETREQLRSTGNQNGKVHLLPGLSDAQIAAAYRACQFTAFPSLIEGWGMPVAESLCEGKFVVASNAGAIPEVGGALIDYHDPRNLDEATAVFERALFEKGYLAQREGAIRAGFAPHSWAQCASEILTALGEVAPAA